MKDDKNVGYYHVCTDGNAIPWMFKDKEDFIKGVNRIAFCCLRVYIKVIDFILMDNHLHFLLYGSGLHCNMFINHYKMLTGRWIYDKYGIKEYLRLLPTEIIRIEDEEHLLNVIAYIDRNSIVAGYKSMPREYPWGIARYMFADEETRDNGHDFRTIGSLSVIEQRSLFRTRKTLPQDWKFDSNGMINPRLFVDISMLERLFKTPSRYTYFLAKKLEGQVEMQFTQSRKVFFPDKELRAIVEKMVKELFGTEDINDLDLKSRITIAKRLRSDYAASIKQISRMVHLDEEKLAGFI